MNQRVHALNAHPAIDCAAAVTMSLSSSEQMPMPISIFLGFLIATLLVNVKLYANILKHSVAVSLA